MLNKNFDLEKAKVAFGKNRRVIIDQVFEPQAAEEIWRGLNDLTERNLWYQSSFGNPRSFDPKNPFWPGNTGNYFAYSFSKFPLTNMSLDIFLENATRNNLEKVKEEFPDHPERELPSGHPLNLLGAFIDSAQGRRVFSEISGCDLSRVPPVAFAAKYMPGDFLSPHSDADTAHNVRIKTKRRLAYVFYMTKYWLPHWGGQLNFLNDMFQITDLVSPGFNSLAIFEVPTLHFVSPVSFYSPQPRLTVTGWYHEKMK